MSEMVKEKTYKFQFTYINISKIKSVQDGREYVWKLQQLFTLILSIYTVHFLKQHNETSSYAKSCFQWTYSGFLYFLKHLNRKSY